MRGTLNAEYPILLGVGNLMIDVWDQMTTKWSNFSIAPGATGGNGEGNPKRVKSLGKWHCCFQKIMRCSNKLIVRGMAMLLPIR
jgi:hypothetical protein